MYTNFATLDKYLNILTGSPEFFGFVGATNHASILTLVHEQDYPKFRTAIDNLEGTNSKSMLLRLKNHKDEYIWVYTVFRYSAEKQDTIEFEIIEIEEMYNKMLGTEVYNHGLKKIISLYRNLLFEYDPRTATINFYYIEVNTKHTLYRGNIDEIARKFITENLIHPDYIATFRDLIRDIKTCANNFSYNILNSISTNGTKNIMDIVSGGAIFCNNKIALVMGAFTNEGSRLNGEDVNRYEKEPMTGLLNKTSIMQYAKDKINSRTTENVVLAIVDMDNFKDVNDNLGHSYGDSVIIKFSEILASVVADKGSVGRFGGDEFLIVFDDIPTILEKRNYFRAIRTNVESEFKNIGKNVSVTCSIGSVSCPTDGTDFNTLFALADKCLYLAKDFGKNRYIMLDERTQKHIHIDTTVGIERNNRVTENMEFMLEINNTLFTNGKAGIIPVLNKINENFGLTRTKIFMGNDMHIEYYAGTNINKDDNAMYAFYENYLNSFSNNNINILENISVLQMNMPFVYNELKKQNIYSVIQYVIKDEEQNTLGIISYELIPPGRCWHENDINYLTMASQVISQILTKNKNI